MDKFLIKVPKIVNERVCRTSDALNCDTESMKTTKQHKKHSSKETIDDNETEMDDEHLSTSKTSKNLIKRNKRKLSLKEEISELELSEEEIQQNACSSRSRKFCQSWLSDFSWLEKEIGPNNNTRPFCKLCKIHLPNLKPHLTRHQNSQQHCKHLESLRNQPLIDDQQRSKIIETKINKIKIAELRIIMFLVQHNLPFSLITGLIALIKVVASDSEIARGIKCGKTKATETTSTLFLEEGLQEVASVLRKQHFSLIIDETTDVSTSKCLVLVVRYFDFIKDKVRDKFLGLVKVDHCDSFAIYTTITNFFKQIDVSLKNLVGFASDNASVMMGSKSGVKALLRKDQPHLYVMGCICHSLHLCSSAASKKLPSYLEALTRNIYAFFAHSPKRQTELKQFQEYFSVKAHKILRVASTRWLSLEQVISRILEQWVPLQHFFLSYTLDRNADLAHNICSEMTEINKTYFCFLAHILNLTNKINIEFQAEAPRIPIFKTYFKTIVQNFLKPQFIEKALNNDIDFNSEAIFLSVEDIYIGAKAAICITNSTISHAEIKDIKNNCREYYTEICKQILFRINFKDDILNAMQGIDPKTLSPSLVIQFPNLVNESEFESLDEEWRSFRNQTFVCNDLNFEEFYVNIFKAKNALYQPMFPNIRKFIGTLIALPHSSATAERKFSEVSLIKDKKRNSLLTSTVNAILMAKELIDNNFAEKWEPSTNLVTKYKKQD